MSERSTAPLERTISKDWLELLHITIALQLLNGLRLSSVHNVAGHRQQAHLHPSQNCAEATHKMLYECMFLFRTALSASLQRLSATALFIPKILVNAARPYASKPFTISTRPAPSILIAIHLPVSQLSKNSVPISLKCLSLAHGACGCLTRAATVTSSNPVSSKRSRKKMSSMCEGRPIIAIASESFVRNMLSGLSGKREPSSEYARPEAQIVSHRPSYAFIDPRQFLL
jgi:hypothetical protein